MGGGVTFEEEIRQQVADGHLSLRSLSKEDKHLSGEYINEFGETAYDTGLMFEQILERNYDKWQEDLSAIDDIEAQDTYYRSVIYPHLKYLEWRVEDRHADQRDGREYESILLYDDSFDDLTDVVFKDTSASLHELVTDEVLCLIFKGLTPAQKEVVYYNVVLDLSIQDISVIKRTTDRNILKIKDTALTHVRGQYLPVALFKYKIQTQSKYHWLFVRGVSTSFWERLFAATIGEEYIDYYPEYKITEETKEDTLCYIEYHNKHVFDFVEITRDFRAWHQRDLDWVSGWNDRKRRCKEQAKRELRKQLDNGNMIDDGNSYEKGVSADYAPNISEQQH